MRRLYASNNKDHMNMRAIVCSLIVALSPAFALAEEIQYTFTGFIEDNPNAPPSFWAGPGPIPTNLVMTFDVDTLSPLNSATYAFGPSPLGPTLNSVSADLAATNFTLSVDGVLVLQNPTGGFSFSTDQRIGQSFFIGQGAGASTSGASFDMFVPDISFDPNSATQAALMGSNDPLYDKKEKSSVLNSLLFSRRPSV